MCTNPAVVGVSRSNGSRVFYPNFFEFRKKQKNNLENASVVPCNKCVSCRKAKALEWSVRMVAESEDWANTYFITLTYEEQFLSFNKFGFPVVSSYDMKKFLQKLKRFVGKNNYAYFYSAEYGTKTKRPHYHLIFFTNENIAIKDISKNNVDTLSGTNEDLLSMWNKGHILIAKSNINSIFYVGQYTLKKFQQNKDLFLKTQRKKEFVSMTKKTPLGFNYFLKNKNKMLFKNKFIVPANVPLISIPKSFINYGLKKDLFTVEEKEYIQTINKKEFIYYFKNLNEKNLSFKEKKQNYQINKKEFIL